LQRELELIVMRRFPIGQLLALALLFHSSLGYSQGLMTLGAGSVAAVAASSFDPATTAWVAQVVTNGGTVSTPREVIVDTFIKCVKSASLWTTLDRYWLYAGENTGAALTDMVSLQSSTVTGAPAFTPSKGYVSSSGSYVDTAYVPSSSAVNYTLNSAVFGGFVNTARVSGLNGFEYGVSNAAFSSLSGLNAWTTGGSIEAPINAAASTAGTSGAVRGNWIVSRTGSAAGGVYYNGSTSAPGFTFTNSSAGLPDHSFAIGGFNQGGSYLSFSGDQISSFFAASGWNSTQASNFYTCESAMMTSIGVLP
jgi:hypothetical protein